MKRAITVVAAMLAVAGAGVGAPLPDALVQKLTETIRRHCPLAKIEVTERAFVAKHGAMMFTLHSISKTGEVSPQTYQQEGPGFRGFILHIAVHDGRYGGAAMAPQTLQGPYFPTFFDAPATDDGKQHYQVHFSYGSGLDPMIRKAVFRAIPKTDFRMGGEGLAGAATDTVIRFNKARLASAADEIPPEFWAEEIEQLQPRKVYWHRNNLAVVLTDPPSNKVNGVYICTAISSFLPGGDPVPLAFGEDSYRFKTEGCPQR